MDNLRKQLNEFGGDLEYCSLEHNVKEVAAVVAGYAAKKLISTSQCAKCKDSLTTTDTLHWSREFITSSN